MSKGAIAWAAVFVVVLVWSGIEPKEVPTWFLGVLPALIAAAVLLAGVKGSACA